MIFDVAAQSLASKSVLLPLEQLLGDCVGSRMPEVIAGRLDFEVASKAAAACPAQALWLEEQDGAHQLLLDYGKCNGCGRCIEACGEAFRSGRTGVPCGVVRSALIRRWNMDSGTEISSEDAALDSAGKRIRSLLGRALNIRQVDAGSCNGCEAEIGALSSPYYDLERFGIHFVASPKHADMLLVTGPVTRNMEEALRHTWEATPSPKLVVAVGACGCSEGIFQGSYAVNGAVDAVIPVDGYIPGCPPTPAMLLTGILRVLLGNKSA
jgi:Ni,Fe-hydrogenase III small subunit/ferredoxin